MNRIFDTLYKSYMLRNLVRDASKFARENLSDIDWSRDYWLRKAGLSTYSPGKRTLGGLGLFAVGLVVGGGAAFALAPKKGAELRKDVKKSAMGMINRAKGIAENTTQQVRA